MVIRGMIHVYSEARRASTQLALPPLCPFASAPLSVIGDQLLGPLESSSRVAKNEIMVTLNALQGENRTAIVLLGEKYGARNIRVFGSLARGDNREDSNVDLLVDKDRGRTLF